MSNPAKVTNFLRKNLGQRYCDDDLAEILKLPRRQEVEQVTLTLATLPHFIRDKGECSVCHKIKMTIYMLDDSRFVECPFGCGQQKISHLVTEDKTEVDNIYQNKYQVLGCGHKKLISSTKVFSPNI